MQFGEITHKTHGLGGWKMYSLGPKSYKGARFFVCPAPLPTPINAANAALDTKKPDTKGARFR